MHDIVNYGTNDNRIASLIAFFLSKYDRTAVAYLGYSTFSAAYACLATTVGAKPNYIKLRRDEFDAFFPGNKRQGWNKRNPRIPEIKEDADAVMSWQEGIETGSHLVFEDALSNFVINNLENKELLQRIFDFAEELLQSDNKYAKNVIYVSFIEPIVYNSDPRWFFEFAKEKTMEIMQDYIHKKLGVKE